MNKKSALVTAGGLTVSFVAGIAAVSFDWGLVGTPATAAAPPSASPKAVKPKIKHRTIVVHKKARPRKTSNVGARVVTLPAPGSSTSTSTSTPSHPVTSTGGSPTTGHDDGGEHETEHGDD